MCLYREKGKRVYDVEQKERIKVYIRFREGKAVCICHRDRKGCDRECEPDVVERDKFDGWKDTFQRNRYGKYPYPDRRDKRKG